MNLLKKKNTSTSLFQKQKHTPEFVVKQTKQKQSILNTLSRAIKEVQFQFASQEPGTEGGGVIRDGRTSQLMCTAFEEVLKHGLKAGWFGQATPSFWPVVLKISRKEATEFIGRLQHAQSDSAKCRGWIRLAVNECSLASYINVLCQDSSILSSYYETYSFVRDPEMTSTLTDLLAGVIHIPFNLTVDVASLEFDSVPEARSDVPIRMRDPYQNRGAVDTPPLVSHKASGKEKPKKRKKVGGRRSPRDGGSLSATPSDSTQSLDDRGSISSESSNGGVSAGVGQEGGHGMVGGVLYEGESGVGYEYEPGSGNETASIDLEYDCSDSEIDWDYWKRNVEGDQLGTLSAVEPVTKEPANLGEGLIKVGDGTGSLTNLAEEIIDQEVGVAGEEFTCEGHDQDTLPRRQSPVGSSNHGNGSEKEEELEYDSKDHIGSDGAEKDRHDTLVEGGVSGAGPIMTLEEVSQRHNTLVEGNSAFSSPEHRSLVSTLTTSQAVYLSTNPFDMAAPAAEEGPSHLHGSNLFSSDLPPTDGTSSTGHRGNSEHNNPYNPFLRESPPLSHAPSTSHAPSSSHAPSTSHAHLSINPFDSESSGVSDLSKPNHSQALPTSLLSLPSSSTTTHISSGDLSPALVHPDLSPLHPDLSPPLSYLNMFTPGERPTISPPPGTPDSLRSQNTPNSSQQPHPSLSQKPRPSSLQQPHPPPTRQPHSSQVLSGEPAAKRPESSSSSENSAPSQSVGTDDLESYSSSSIDISFADYAQLQLEQRVSRHKSDQLTSPDENYFQPEVNMVDVQLALDRLKVDLLKGEEDNEEVKDTMRRKIVELQMQLQQLKDTREEKRELPDSSVKELYGHQLLEQKQRTGMIHRECGGCGKRIRGLLRPWYLCKLCGFTYHKKCLSLVDRICSACSSHSSMDDSHAYILEVCPERGLTRQHFRCGRCNVGLINTATLTRLCDYCGQYFCPNCHRNDEAVIPARVIHNWDFTSKKVCCRCYDYLERWARKPMLRIHPINPLLYTYVQDLSHVESLRRDLIVMKKYLLECPSAKETHLLQRLDEFPHFKDGSKRFSLGDLLALHNDTLQPKLRQIHLEFSRHIKRECLVCSQRGFTCVLCKSEETLYPFDNRCRQCPKCQSLFHKNCYTEMTTCPKCSRVRTHRKRV